MESTGNALKLKVKALWAWQCKVGGPICRRGNVKWAWPICRRGTPGGGGFSNLHRIEKSIILYAQYNLMRITFQSCKSIFLDTMGLL